MNTSPIAHKLASEDYVQSRISSRAEIGSLLAGLADERNAITLYFGGNDFIVSRVLSVDSTNRTVVFDLGADTATNAKLFAAEEVLAISTLQNVTLEFSLPRMESIQLDDGPAARGPLPEFILRSQRRENFRVPTPALRPIAFHVPIQDGTGTPAILRVVDISCGGLRVEGDASALQVSSGLVLDNCSFDLPEIGQVRATVEVRHVEMDESTPGKKKFRCGLRFLSLSPQTAALVQRYVMRLEREWRALR
ncbi:MAG TPA: flagellar regulator YcgR PilZN domain-containing protein [Burkholderiales bacterium]|nr:flagellar regulator YcgR PilZN domain-containing protein [Burkholderiales bacterium]